MIIWQINWFYNTPFETCQSCDSVFIVKDGQVKANKREKDIDEEKSYIAGIICTTIIICMAGVLLSEISLL